MSPNPFCDPTPQDGLARSKTAAVSVLLFLPEPDISFRGWRDEIFISKVALTILTINALSSRKVLWQACSRGY